LTESDKFKKLSIATVQERKTELMQKVGTSLYEKHEDITTNINYDKRRIAVRKKDEVLYEDSLEVKA
jgi:hypothetical protein